jgi:gluconolactonase
MSCTQGHIARTAAALALSLAGAADLAAQAPLFADGFETTCGAVSYAEGFAQPDGAAWPSPWVVVGGTALADIQGGRARLRSTPSNYSLARLYAPVATRDVEVRFRMAIESEATQGVGFYVRQNGGYLNGSTPTGQGYAVFVEGSFRNLPGIGLWKEENGVEIPLAHSSPAVAGPAVGSSYRVRFRVHQSTPTSTYMQAKFWLDGAPEPIAWQVAVSDSTPVLQNLGGGIAVDSWSVIQAPNPITTHTFVDDIEVEPLCNPIIGLGPAALVAESFQFTEGPLWRGDHLLFSDISGNTIYRLDPPGAISVFRTPSDQSNGLERDIDGDLLAAEHGTRRISTTDANTGVRTTLVSTYQGARLNSPNDMAMRSDGTLWFTDPDYGLSNPPVQRELAFNGLFRRRTDGSLVLEWAGTVGTNQPNGVVLSPDQSLLFVSDTQQGTLRRWNVAADGTLSNPLILATGLGSPDGLCIDTRGNVYVTTSPGAVQVFTPDGARWGSIPIPRAAANCTFGDADGRSLYVTARQGLYRVR